MPLSTANKIRSRIIAIFLLAIFCFLIVLPQVSDNLPFKDFWNKFSFHLGLDLQGGTHLVYTADTSEVEDRDRESAVEGVRDVIERRVNAFGVSEPVVQTNFTGSEYRVIVELAGVKDVNQAIQMIGETPLLEFKEENPAFEAELSEEEQQQLDQENEAVRLKAEEVLTQALVPGVNFQELASKFSEDTVSAQNGGDLGFSKFGMFVPEFDEVIFEKQAVPGVYPELVLSQFGYHVIQKIEERGGAESFDLENEAATTEREVHSAHILFRTKTAADFKQADQWINTELSGKHLTRAQYQENQNTFEPEVGLEFNEEGKELFAEITTRNVGKPVAILLDGEIISAPNVSEPIREGNAVITGRFNRQEAIELVQRLNAGALPIPINIISQQTVGASLGSESVDKSLSAGLFGLLAVAIFMLLYYRLPGLLSVIALAIYICIVLTVFKIFSITLTLAGVAGFILSIGMAVDANILIFERLKEELRHGRELDSSIEEGFKRAWTSIRDSNISTILITLILIFFGTSIVKGFGITLLLGVLISMFSAVVITRTFLRTFNKIKKMKWLFSAGFSK